MRAVIMGRRRIAHSRKLVQVAGLRTLGFSKIIWAKPLAGLASPQNPRTSRAYPAVPQRSPVSRKVFKRYHQRQREQFSFKDGKQSLATAKMPTSKLEANRMHVKIVALAQSMLQLFA